MRRDWRAASLLPFQGEIKSARNDAREIFDYVLRMKLDPHIAAWAKHFGAQPDFDWRGPVEDVRRRFWRFAHDLETDAPALHDIRDVEVGGAEGKLPARLYTPIGAGVSGPGIVYFHGGAFVLGDLDSHELLCRRLADAAHMRVLSVAYRLAPEHRFPAAAEDAIAAARWAVSQGSEFGIDGRVAVAGDSAGGNLVAVVSQQTRKDLALKAQLLIYPSTQWVEMTPSQVRLREGHLLTQAVQDFFKDKYLRSREDGYDTRASPLLENDLTGLPPAYIVTGALDPLRDEGKAYADKMAACGVGVTYREYAAQPHGFFSMTSISSVAKEAIAEAGAWLAQRMG
jgi:acetyl esterase